MDFSEDHFALLGVPRCFALDSALLESNYRSAQARVHPDRFAHAGDAERRRSVQWSAHVNEAYQTLRRPLSRALYLLGLHGVEVGAESNTAMPAEFLVEQMEWREAVAEARQAADAAELDSLHHRMRKEVAVQFEALHQALDVGHDYPRAAELVRQLMFQEKLLHEIDDALEAVEA